MIRKQSSRSSAGYGALCNMKFVSWTVTAVSNDSPLLPLVDNRFVVIANGVSWANFSSVIACECDFIPSRLNFSHISSIVVVLFLPPWWRDFPIVNKLFSPNNLIFLHWRFADDNSLWLVWSPIVFCLAGDSFIFYRFLIPLSTDLSLLYSYISLSLAFERYVPLPFPSTRR
jgi:hypothetical protein